ncbi:hypothetical protein [Corynebacterium meitnerae]|uniref:Secreted protein n=1 Tax=Corynebacterium meitnerae TaxID=2913498 RepID=A0A9X3LSQ5_9CORY|nr:hypothetical protein [Corynebacterium meitnerae]MCZ9293387.1 hypothetical protein [Corynebacterium meitnerae]
MKMNRSSIAVSAACVAALAVSGVAGAGAANAAPALERNTCEIAYTEAEIPALAAEKLWLPQLEGTTWREALKAYNARKAELKKQLDEGNNTIDIAGTLSVPMAEPGKKETGSSVFGNLSKGSSLTPERLGHWPYGALAFMYNASTWEHQVVTSGCPAERPAPPAETRDVTVPESSAVAPKEWQGALIGVLMLLGVVAAVQAVLPMLQGLRVPTPS